jgi:hypothetical protein
MLVNEIEKKTQSTAAHKHVYIAADIYLQIKNCASVFKAHTYLSQHKKIFLLIHHLKNEGPP